mmetsp:Transcript_33758/g.32817  ORF Transcript_33758/g.32817 Transcript_33758/m.32817 type:complete len:248 (+) Transcript_33758:116-859(+)
MHQDSILDDDFVDEHVVVGAAFQGLNDHLEAVHVIHARRRDRALQLHRLHLVDADLFDGVDGLADPDVAFAFGGVVRVPERCPLVQGLHPAVQRDLLVLDHIGHVQVESHYQGVLVGEVMLDALLVVVRDVQGVYLLDGFQDGLPRLVSGPLFLLGDLRLLPLESVLLLRDLLLELQERGLEQGVEAFLVDLGDLPLHDDVHLLLLVRLPQLVLVQNELVLLLQKVRVHHVLQDAVRLLVIEPEHEE